MVKNGHYYKSRVNEVPFKNALENIAVYEGGAGQKNNHEPVRSLTR